MKKFLVICAATLAYAASTYANVLPESVQCGLKDVKEFIVTNQTDKAHVVLRHAISVTRLAKSLGIINRNETTTHFKSVEFDLFPADVHSTSEDKTLVGGFPKGPLTFMDANGVKTQFQPWQSASFMTLKGGLRNVYGPLNMILVRLSVSRSITESDNLNAPGGDLWIPIEPTTAANCFN